jgi:hypothetical protein
MPAQAIAKEYGSHENIVSATFLPDKFVFVVETTGALPPEQVRRAVVAIGVFCSGSAILCLMRAQRTTFWLLFFGTHSLWRRHLLRSAMFGCPPPAQIVESALRVLVTKMGMVQAVAQELPGGRV